MGNSVLGAFVSGKTVSVRTFLHQCWSSEGTARHHHSFHLVSQIYSTEWDIGSKLFLLPQTTNINSQVRLYVVIGDFVISKTFVIYYYTILSQKKALSFAHKKHKA